MKDENSKHLIPGFGPKSSAALAAIGIFTIEELKSHGVYEIYRKLKENVPGTSLNFLYALIAATDGCHWQEVKRRYRTQILLRLDEMGLAPK